MSSSRYTLRGLVIEMRTDGAGARLKVSGSEVLTLEELRHVGTAIRAWATMHANARPEVIDVSSVEVVRFEQASDPDAAGEGDAGVSVRDGGSLTR